MKICPKCRQNYEDSVDFCLKDGKPLILSDAEEVPPVEDVSVGTDLSEGPSSVIAGRLAEGSPLPPAPSVSPGRPKPAYQLFSQSSAGVAIKRVSPPVPVATSHPIPRPVTDDSLSGRRIQIPQTLLNTSVSGIRITMPDGLKSATPPWELPAPLPEHKSPTTENAIPRDVAGKEASAAEGPTVIKTPDLPLPPEIREAAVPVGDETVLELAPDAEPEAPPEEELELIPTPPVIAEAEFPLTSRFTTRAALPRPMVHNVMIPPPVPDEPEEQDLLLAIHTEADITPPDPGEDEDAHPNYVVINPYRPKKPIRRGFFGWFFGIFRDYPVVAGMAFVGVGAVVLAGALYLPPEHPTPVTTSARPEVNTKIALASEARFPTNPRPTVIPAPTPDATPTPAPTVVAIVPPTPVPRVEVTVIPTKVASAPPARAPNAIVNASTPPAKVAADSRTRATDVPNESARTVDRTMENIETAATPATKKANPPPVAEPVKVAETPEPAPALKSVKVIIVSNAIGAEVFVNGEQRGTIPVTVVISEGKHKVRVVPKDREQQERMIEVDGSRTTQSENFQF